MTEAPRRKAGAVNGSSLAGCDLPDLEIAIIGAGPHGLSAAVHLGRAGVAAHVFGVPMSSWRGMPNGMRLRSNMSATNMIEPAGPFSLESYMAEIGERFGHPVSLRRFVDYGLWVQRTTVPDVDARMVTQVTRSGGGFVLTLEDGAQVTARRVVVACGIGAFENMPGGFDHLPAELVSHTGHHDDLARFAGKRVAVVGAGQSAFESAVLMTERGADVEVIARGREIVWLRSWSPIHFMGRLGRIVYAPTDVGPLWYSRLVATPRLFTQLPRDTQDKIARRSIRPACSYFVKVRVDGVRLTTATEVTSAQPARDGLELTLSDGTTRHVDHLMFGTGYKVDVARYPFLNESLVTDIQMVDGYPTLRPGFESHVPGLHFLGAPAARSFGPIMRFVSGSWYGGTRLAQAVAQGREGRTLRTRNVSRARASVKA